MAIGMPVWLMQSDIAWLMLSFSVSKPTMKPAVTNMPCS